MANTIEKTHIKTLGIDARMLNPHYTGIGRYVFELCHRLPLLYPHKQFVLFTHKKNQPYIPQFSNVSVVICHQKHYSIAEQTTFRHTLYQHKCDTYFFPHFNVPINFKKPYTVTIHDLTLSKYPPTGVVGRIKQILYKKVIKSAVKNAKTVMCVSHNTKQDLFKAYKWLQNQEKTHTVHNGVTKPKNKENNTKNEEKIEEKEKYIFYSGNWKPHKNIPKLLQAFALFLKDFPDVRLKLTGKPTQKGLFWLKKLNIEKNVDLLGHISEEKLQKTLKNAHTYAFCSLYEGFGLPPLEAMAQNVPVLASFRSSIPEVCQNAAIFADPFDENHIATQLKHIFTDENLRKELIIKGNKRILAFSWEKCANEVGNLLL